jgi:RNA polymerase sigma factor for flagellar operon FliA
MDDGIRDTAPARQAADELRKARHARLWREWRRRGDRRARDVLIESLMPLVQAICHRRLRAGLPALMERDDMLSTAYEALIAAVEKYEPARGASIESFAWKRCEGAVLDWLRDQSPGSRGLQAYERRRQALCERLDREPSHAEIAARLELSPEQVCRREAERLACRAVPLDDATHRFVARDPLEDPVASLELHDLRRLVRDALGRLPQRKRAALVGPELHDASLSAVGRALGVSASRVSQLRSETIGELRDDLGPRLELPAAA